MVTHLQNQLNRKYGSNLDICISYKCLCIKDAFHEASKVK